MTGRADFFADGDWNTVCYQCGRKRKASTMKKHWQGYWVCPEHWEPREAQDFVRNVPDVITAPWVQPMPADAFRAFCTPEGMTGIADYAVADCWLVEYISPFLDLPIAPTHTYTIWDLGTTTWDGGLTLWD